MIIFLYFLLCLSLSLPAPPPPPFRPEDNLGCHYSSTIHLGFLFPIHLFHVCIYYIVYFVPDSSGDQSQQASTTETAQELSCYSPSSNPSSYSLGCWCQRSHCYQCFPVALGAISECNLSLKEDKARLFLPNA